MKKIFVLFCLSLAAIVYFCTVGGQAAKEKNAVQIYYVDRRLHRLVPVDYIPKSVSTKGIAREITEKLISPNSDNPEILRLLPYTEDSITVDIKDTTALIDLSSELVYNIEKNIETERLVIYQLVNSLTSIDGIDTVRFTIDKSQQRKFLGFLNMHEIFTPNYDI